MTFFRANLKRIICGAWIFILGLTILVSAQTSYRRSLKTEEYAYACDPFGYLKMAKEIRSAFGRGHLPDFRLESPQTRLLINFLQEQRIPVADWEEVVAPHAHHFFPRSNYVGVQYPPGTGLTLAMFPEGTAVYRLNKTVVISLALIGLAALALAAWKQAWISSGLIALTMYLGFSVLARMGTLSFSINAVLIPLLLTCVLSVVAVKFEANKKTAWASVLAFVAGTLAGFSTLIRLPVVFLGAGFLILLWPRKWKTFPRLSLLFALGVLIVGVIPILFHQQAIAGAWYLPTYASIDAMLTTIDRLPHNLNYYFDDGPAAEDNWAVRDAVIGFVGFIALFILARRNSEHVHLTWKRVGISAAVIWLVSTLFFVTHWTVGPHYAFPGIFAAVAVVAFGSLLIESFSSEGQVKLNFRKPIVWFALALAVWPAVNTINQGWTDRTSLRAPVEPQVRTVVVPPELADPKAWVWADLLTGSFWYYANKPAYKIQFTNPETRARIFRFVFERGEPQYLIQDSERMQTYMNEIQALGGTLELKGKINNQDPYFLVHWPQEGPANRLVVNTQ